MDQAPWNGHGGGDYLNLTLPVQGQSYVDDFAGEQQLREHRNSDGDFAPDEAGESEEEDNSPAPAPGAASATPQVPSGYQGVIRNHTDFQNKRVERINQERAAAISQGKVHGGPTDDAGDRVCVQKIFDGLVNTYQVYDRDTKNGNPAQAVQRFMTNYYDNETLELLSWQILEKCKDSQLGVTLVDPRHLNPAGVEVYNTFNDRLEAVVEACRSSKAVCKSLLDANFIDRLVDSPAYELNRKKNNNEINAHRNRQNAFGRLSIARGLELEELDRMTASRALKGEDAGPNVAQSFITPKRGGVTSQATSSKRKKQAKGKGKGKSGLQDEDDEEFSEYETPAKKSKRGQAQPSRSNPARTPSHSAKKPSRLDSATKFSHRRQPPMSDPFRPSSMRLSSLGLTPTANLPSTAFGNPGPGAINYRQIICDILQIDRRFANEFSLAQLRVYARAYNSEFKDYTWYDARDGGGHGQGFQWNMPDNQGNVVPIAHFAQLMEDLFPIAVARGDLTPEGVLSQSPTTNVSFSVADSVHRQALGLIDNPYNLHSELYDTFA